MQICLNTLYIKNNSIENKIKSCAMAKFDAIEMWVDEIDGNIPLINSLLKDNNIYVSSVEKLAGWFENDGQLMNTKNDHISIIDECKRRMELAASVGSKKIIACPSFSHRGFSASINQGIDYFFELLEIGNSLGVEPTIEFMGQTGQINNIKIAMEFLSHIPNSRMVVDAYHIWKFGDDMSVLESVDQKKISLLHISDADCSIPRNLHKDSDRVLPGDGCINLNKFIEISHKIGYDREISIGVYNPKFWEIDVYESTKIIKQKFDSLTCWQKVLK